MQEPEKEKEVAKSLTSVAVTEHQSGQFLWDLHLKHYVRLREKASAINMYVHKSMKIS